MQLAIGGNFGVTNDGTLYASGATIAGNTTITANSVNITGTGNSAFNVNMTNFKIDSSGNITVTGKIQATSGYIGTNSTNGWTIDSNTIRHGATNSTDAGAIALSASTFTRSINSTNRSNLQLAIGSKFGIANDGTLYASGAVLSGYSTTSEMNSAIETSASGITAKFNNYSTTDQMNSAISASASGVLSTVSTTYATKDNVSSSISQSATNILSTVSSTYATQESVSTVDQKADGISLSVTNITNGTTGVPHVATSGIDISGNSITMTSGTITLTTGALITNGFRIDGGEITVFNPHSNLLGWQFLDSYAQVDNTLVRSGKILFQSGCGGDGGLRDGNLGNQVFLQGGVQVSPARNSLTGTIPIGFVRFPPSQGTLFRIVSWGTVDRHDDPGGQQYAPDHNKIAGGYCQINIQTAVQTYPGLVEIRWIREANGDDYTETRYPIWIDISTTYWV